MRDGGAVGAVGSMIGNQPGSGFFSEDLALRWSN